jgi:hypothetical protein
MVLGSASKAANLNEAATGQARNCGTLAFDVDDRKTKMRESASNQNGGVGRSPKRGSGLKSFLLLNFEIQWQLEGVWFNGAEASGKLFSYPA